MVFGSEWEEAIVLVSVGLFSWEWIAERRVDARMRGVLVKTRLAIDMQCSCRDHQFDSVEAKE